MARFRRWRRVGEAATGGYTMVEFAIASVLLLMVVIGSIDVGRAIYLNSELNNGVREAAREAKVGEANGFGWSGASITERVHVAKHPITNATSDRPGLGAAVVSYSCTGACGSGDQLTVDAELPFSAVAQSFLGLSPITLHASATVTIE